MDEKNTKKNIFRRETTHVRKFFLQLAYFLKLNLKKMVPLSKFAQVIYLIGTIL